MVRAFFCCRNIAGAAGDYGDLPYAAGRLCAGSGAGVECEFARAGKNPAIGALPIPYLVVEGLQIGEQMAWHSPADAET